MSSRFTHACLFALLLVSAAHGHEWNCAGAAAAGEGMAPPQYAPPRRVDITHLALDVTPVWQEQAVEGTATLTFQALPQTTKELVLHAKDLRVSQVRSTLELDHYQNTGEELIFTFKEPIPMGDEHRISIDYKAFPQKGLYFRTAAQGYKPEDEHIYTQGETTEARHWYPSFDSPNEKFTSEITCRVPESMVVLSNGRLASEESAGNGLKSVRWIQEKPHVNYLISLVAGRFEKIEDEYRGIPLAFYTPTSQIQYARNSFEDTREMMAFFEQEIGVPYPWNKYYQVCVQDFGWGGMENTSISTLNQKTLHPDETENLRTSQGLVAHELAHQWFGDLVTCEDWSHIWLNEGFATYYSHLYNGHKKGRDDFLYGLYHSANSFLNRSAEKDIRPTAFRNYENAGELFGYLVYPKGAWILHMMRSQLGEGRFRQAVKSYLEQHQFGSVVTHDLIAAVEEVSGQSWQRFFDQWVFQPHHPELKVSYKWDAEARQAQLEIRQVQPLTNGIALFHLPLKLAFRGENGTVEKEILVQQQAETFYFFLPEAPRIVRLDPRFELAAKIDFPLPRPMLMAQLADEDDVMGRIFAVQQLADSKDTETVEALEARLNEDPFYGVRIEAAEALRKIHTREALEALIAGVKQEDARVRQQVVSEIGQFYDPAARDVVLNLLRSEKNPDIARSALASLDAYPGEETYQALLRSLETPSFRNVVALGGIQALRKRNDSAAVPAILQALRERREDFLESGLGTALETLAYLSREAQDASEMLSLLIEYTGYPRQSVRLSAIEALGILEDDRALPVLERFATGHEDAPETTRAERAVEAIRSRRQSSAELSDLREEMLKVKQQHEKLKATVTELEKKLEAAQAVDK